MTAIGSLFAAAALCLSCADGEQTLSSGGAGGSGGEGGAEPVCDFVDYDDESKLAPEPVSLMGDVMPIFQDNCTGNGNNCHSATTSRPAAGLSLAPPPSMVAMPTDAAALHGDTVEVDATRAALKLVEPGDPAASFLLIKMEYEKPASCLPAGALCLTNNCGNLMPTGAAAMALSESEKATLRRWIRDGADNN